MLILQNKLKNLFKFKNVKNEEEFRKLVKNNGLTYEIIIEKIKYEGLWNDLYIKNLTLVKIDKEELKKLIIKISDNKNLNIIYLKYYRRLKRKFRS